MDHNNLYLDILTENNLEDTVKTLTLKINLKEDKKQKILNLIH